MATVTKTTKHNKIRKSKMKSTGERVYTFILEIKDGKQIKKKFCVCCEEYKIYADYHKNKKLPEGVGLYCKDCTKNITSTNQKKITVTGSHTPIKPAAKKEVTVNKVAKTKKVSVKQSSAASSTLVAENFALLTNRLSAVEEAHQLRLKETTLVSIISALVKRNGGELEFTKDELESVGECSFDMKGEKINISSRKTLVVS